MLNPFVCKIPLGSTFLRSKISCFGLQFCNKFYVTKTFLLTIISSSERLSLKEARIQVGKFPGGKWSRLVNHNTAVLLFLKALRTYTTKNMGVIFRLVSPSQVYSSMISHPSYICVLAFSIPIKITNNTTHNSLNNGSPQITNDFIYNVKSWLQFCCLPKRARNRQKRISTLRLVRI